jgi:hypothetical protein
MQLFKCQHCSQLLFFENKLCESCHHRLGYIPADFQLSALKPANANAPDGGEWTALSSPGSRFRFCDNAKEGVCNWLVPASSHERYCLACRHNRTVPDLSTEENRRAWDKIEIAKHRLFYQLTRLGLPTPNKADDGETGLVFDFLADPETSDGPKVLTGHDNGLITLALSEADDAERERRRTAMHEPYRALMGHFRHEVGHYYWDRLVRDQGLLAECRAVFGDDEADYGEALKRHYENGPPAGWRENFVSAYATTHAWEDWAETWAHYLHIVDSLDTAGAFGLEVHPSLTQNPALHARLQVDSYAPGDFTRLVDAWLPLTFAMNSMNRSMGLPDLYPFVLTTPVIRKLSFIHDLVHRPRQATQKAA